MDARLYFKTAVLDRCTAMVRPTYISAKGHMVGRVARRLVLNGGGAWCVRLFLRMGLVITYRADLSLVTALTCSLGRKSLAFRRSSRRRRSWSVPMYSSVVATFL